MDLKEIKIQKEQLEKSIMKIFNDFEANTDCAIEAITLKRRHIEAGIGSRDVVDKVMVKISIE